MFLSIVLFCACSLNSTIEPLVDFEGVEEERVLSDLKSGRLTINEDAGFVEFIVNTLDRLMLPQTYDSSVSDFALTVGNYTIWEQNQTLRKAISGLCCKISSSCKADSPYLQDVYAMIGLVAEKYPINERYRLLKFMNNLDGLVQKNIKAAQDSEKKAQLDLENQAAKEKLEQEKLAAKQAADLAKTQELQNKVRNVTPVRSGRQSKSTTFKQSSDGNEATLPDEQKSIKVAKPRGRPRKITTDESPVAVQIQEPSPENAAPEHDRFIRYTDFSVVTEPSTMGDQPAESAP